MPKLKAYILDDELGSINALKWELKAFDDALEIVGSSADTVEAKESISELNIDILFLDINMPVENGFDFVKNLNKVDFEVVFTTAYDEYALKAFELSAIDYLLKPVDFNSLNRAIQRVIEKKDGQDIVIRLENLFSNFHEDKETRKKIALPDINGINFVEIAKINYCSSDSNYCHIFTADTKLTISKTLKEIEAQLPSKQFIRIHHSYLVNIDCIKQYRKGKDGCIVLEDGTILPVSRTRKDIFKSGI